MKNKPMKNAKMNKILGCSNTAMKLGTDGEKRFLSSAGKTQFQPNHHFLAEDDIPLVLPAYNRHLCPVNTFSHILPDFHFCHKSEARKFLCFFTPQYVFEKKRKSLNFNTKTFFILLISEITL